MQKEVREILANIQCIRNILREIDIGGSLENHRDEISTILDEHLEVLLNTKVKI